MYRSNNKPKDYNQISLSDFSDDSSNEGDDHHVAPRKPNHNVDAEYGNYRDEPLTPQHRQQQMLQQQDAGLEMLAKSADRLGTMSMAISDELQAQNQILDDMDEDLEQATEHLDFVTRKTKEFIAQSGGTKNCILIATLSGIVVLLILLIVYTWEWYVMRMRVTADEGGGVQFWVNMRPVQLLVFPLSCKY